MAITCKEGVAKFKPHTSEEVLYEKGDNFLELLLTKLINAERAAYCSPKFRKIIENMRKDILDEIMEEYYPFNALFQ